MRQSSKVRQVILSVDVNVGSLFDGKLGDRTVIMKVENRNIYLFIGICERILTKDVGERVTLLSID